MLGTERTVLDPSGHKPRFWRNPIRTALIAANILLFFALIIAWLNNAELQKIANERAEEVKALTQKCVACVHETLEKMDEDQEPAQSPEKESAPDAEVVERW